MKSHRVRYLTLELSFLGEPNALFALNTVTSNVVVIKRVIKLHGAAVNVTLLNVQTLVTVHRAALLQQVLRGKNKQSLMHFPHEMLRFPVLIFTNLLLPP